MVNTRNPPMAASPIASAFRERVAGVAAARGVRSCSTRDDTVTSAVARWDSRVTASPATTPLSANEGTVVTS